MKRTPLARKSPMKRGGRVKPINKARRTSEFARTYGSKARVAWVKALPCSVMFCENAPCENAHIANAGAGRKADYRFIVPLCPHHHRLQHTRGWPALGGAWGERVFREAKAAIVQMAWEWDAEGE